MSSTPQNKEVRNDEALVEATKGGDDNAYQELMRRYAEAIYNFARQYAKNDEDAEDITQDSFYKAWKHIKRFTAERAWKPWLYARARNTALDYVKKKKASSFSELDDDENEL